jgi:hypothetical protein
MNVPKIRFQKTIILIGSLFISGIIYSQPDINIDPALNSNSYSWKVKIKQRIFGKYKPALINFGPIKTLDANTDKSNQENREVSRELFWKTVKTVTSRESNLQIVYNDNDTITINILSVSEENIRKRNAAGVFTNVNNEDGSGYKISSVVNEMLIHFAGDTTDWHFIKSDSAQHELTGQEGVLQNSVDSFVVKRINNFSGKKMNQIMFSQPATGFTVFHKGEPIAAFQTLMKNKVWVSKNLSDRDKKGILAAIAGFFATIKSEDENGI